MNNSKIFYIWNDVFDNFDKAEKNSIGDGFAGAVWKNRSLTALMECKDSVVNGKQINLLHRQRSANLVPLVAILAEKKESFRVLDFGGGLGLSFIDLNQSLQDQNLKINYTILEIPEVCSIGREFNDYKNLFFIDEFPKNKFFDLIFSSSALQYVSDWKAFLRNAAELGAEYIYLVDVFCGQIPSFVTLQTYYESKIPHWFLNFDELKGEMWQCGYEVKFKTPLNVDRLGSNQIDMSNFPKKYQIESTLNILFKKR